eukprot:1992349-Pyramimonas_sp.AAC.1
MKRPAAAGASDAGGFQVGVARRSGGHELRGGGEYVGFVTAEKGLRAAKKLLADHRGRRFPELRPPAAPSTGSSFVAASYQFIYERNSRFK